MTRLSTEWTGYAWYHRPWRTRGSCKLLSNSTRVVENNVDIAVYWAKSFFTSRPASISKCPVAANQLQDLASASLRGAYRSIYAAFWDAHRGTLSPRRVLLMFLRTLRSFCVDTETWSFGSSKWRHEMEQIPAVDKIPVVSRSRPSLQSACKC